MPESPEKIKESFESAVMTMYWYDQVDFELDSKGEYLYTQVFDYFKVWEKARNLYTPAPSLTIDPQNEATAVETLGAILQMVKTYYTTLDMTPNDCVSAIHDMLIPWPLTSPKPIFHTKADPI